MEDISKISTFLIFNEEVKKRIDHLKNRLDLSWKEKAIIAWKQQKHKFHIRNNNKSSSKTSSTLSDAIATTYRSNELTILAIRCEAIFIN